MKNQIKTDTHTLIRQIQSGDRRAFQILIEENQRLVTHIVFRIVSNAADREDLCQDVFMKVYKNLSGFRFGSKLSTWIGQIAYNTSINYVQKKKATLYEDHVPQGQSLDTISGKTILPDTYTERKDLSSRLQTEIDNLDMPYRTILTLYHVEEMSYSEISRIMDLPEGTVKSYLFRARERLKINLMCKYKREELCHVTT